MGPAGRLFRAARVLLECAQRDAVGGFAQQQFSQLQLQAME